MTLAQLRAFLAALERGSFTAASVELNSTQASVSELVARLERELGLKLFTRGSRRLLPTSAALELRDHAVQAVTAISNGVDAIHALSSLQGGTCTFGVLRNAAYYDLSDLVQRFHDKHPKVKVRLVGINSALVAESVASGEIDAGLVVLPVAETGLSVKPLFQDEVLYASATRTADRGPVTIQEMARAKLVLYDAYAGWSDPTRKQLLERARRAGVHIDPAIEVEHVETALNLVSQGSADTMVSRTIAEGPSFPRGINVIPMTEPLFDTLALIYREGSPLTPATRRFAELTESILLANVSQHAGRTALLPEAPGSRMSVGGTMMEG